MAITIHIFYSGEKGNARNFCEEMISSGIVETIRQEDGNLRYEYFFPVEDKETVLLIDSWNDQTALDIHHASTMMAQITQLREKYDLHMRVERYKSDDGKDAEKDEKFQRK